MTSESLFWADQLADKVVARTSCASPSQPVARAASEKSAPVIRCGQTPSGGKHIGNLNDVVRAYFVYKSLRERGVNAEFVHSTDDRDPLKDVPARIADLDGKWYPSEKFPEMNKWLGKPLCRIPDPFGCCETWSKHFTELWARGLRALGINPKIVSNDDYYKQGKFEPYIRLVFEKSKKVSGIVSKFQETKGKGYIPFDAICPKCGVLTNISSFDLESKTVGFVCGGKAIKKRRAEGCGFKGTVPWSEGKLQWRFEWPAQWAIEKTTFEPMGKDHWEGSWKSGEVIAKEIYGIEPPIPYVYEFFLVDGQKMSASKGNVYIVQDMLKIIEPEPFLYFYTKKPGKQRDLSLKEIFVLANEFDRIEDSYFNIGKIKDEHEKNNIIRSYFMAVEKISKTKPVRIPYTFASIIAQIVPEERALAAAIKLLTSMKHVSMGLTEEEKQALLRRLQVAKYWVGNFAAPEYRICSELPEEVKKFSKEIRDALHALGNELKEKECKEDELYNRIVEIAKENKVETKAFFRAAYIVIIGKPVGPPLAPLIIAIGEKEAAERFLRI